VSKKLRAFMSLVAIETLAMRVAGARQALELLDPALGIVAASQFLQVIANQLVEAFSESLRRFLARATVCSSIDKVTFIDTVYVCAYPVSTVAYRGAGVPSPAKVGLCRSMA